MTTTFWDRMRAEGWDLMITRAAVEAGWVLEPVDLVGLLPMHGFILRRGSRTIYVETVADDERHHPEVLKAQLTALRASGMGLDNVFVWRPGEWPQIQQVLQ